VRSPAKNGAAEVAFWRGWRGQHTRDGEGYRWIGIKCCACRDWPFSSGSKPIDLGLGFQVHWVPI
jgi:hypothetical protein